MLVLMVLFEGPKGEFVGVYGQDNGMSEFFKRIDSPIMDRKTYELAQAMQDEVPPGFPNLKNMFF